MHRTVNNYKKQREPMAADNKYVQEWYLHANEKTINYLLSQTCLSWYLGSDVCNEFVNQVHIFVLLMIDFHWLGTFMFFENGKI